jgi:hypothetical protein
MRIWPMNGRELSPVRRRIARLALTVAAIVSCFMLSALPMDVWVLAGSGKEQIAFAVLLAVVVGSIWAHVGIARRRPYGPPLVLALGAYALVMIVYRAIQLTRLPVWISDSVLVGAMVVSGALFFALLVAAVACVPAPRSADQDNSAAPAV